MPRPVTFILGCTGCGKGALGLELAQRTGGEIISIDSMKVYRRMDIGTAKPSTEVRAKVPHHLIDVVEPSEEFSVAQYVRLAEQALEGIERHGRPAFVVGGTPLYVKALSEGLFEGPGADSELRRRLTETAERDGLGLLHERLKQVDPTAAARIHANDLRRIVRALEVFELTGSPISSLQEQWDRQRTKFECLFIGLRRDKEDQNHRINERVRKMLAAGLVDEVRRLLAEPKPLGTAARQAVGYIEVIDFLDGKHDLDTATELIKINTRQLAKAQRTWFKRFTSVEWVDLSPDSKVGDVADTLMSSHRTVWGV